MTAPKTVGLWPLGSHIKWCLPFEELFVLYPVNRCSVELWMCFTNSNGNAWKSGTIFDQNLALLLGLDIVLAIE